MAARGGERLVPRRSPSVHGVELDSESVLYDERSGRLHFLNSSASAVWWSIDGTASADELAADLADRYQTPADVISDDVSGLLKMLERQELIETVGPRRRRRQP